MLLLIDVGNTYIKWSIPYNNNVYTAHWRYLGSAPRNNIKDLIHAWSILPIKKVIISNVAGPRFKSTLQTLLHSTFGTNITITWFISQSKLAGLYNKYKNPSQLGCDRFASAIGAHKIFPQRSLIIITCGTATTIDDVTKEGIFMGGIILPGLKTMLSSLAKTTNLLPIIKKIQKITLHTPNNTIDGISLGCILAQIGAIELVIAAHHKKYKKENSLCIISGGAGATLATYINTTTIIIENLVLVGLHIAALHY